MSNASLPVDPAVMALVGTALGAAIVAVLIVAWFITSPRYVGRHRDDDLTPNQRVWRTDPSN